MYLIAFIHEMSHVTLGLIFKMKVEKIKFLPFGFSAEFVRFEDEKWFKQLLVVLAGPASYFISLLILKAMYQNGMFSYYSFVVANNSNLFVALFNLIPFYPLDGGRAVEIICARHLSEKKTRILRYIISFFALIGIGVISGYLKQVPLFIYLTITYIIQLITSKREYIMFLLKRLYSSKKKKVKVVKKDEIYRYFHCVKLSSNGLEDEPSIIKKLLLRLKRGSKREISGKK